MSERTLKQLVGALVVALVIWGVASFLSGEGGPIAATGQITEFFDGMDRSTVTAVRFRGPEQSIELLPDGDRWTVNGHASDSLFVDRLFRAFEEAGSGDLAGTNPTNHDRMGVSADGAVALEVEMGSETRTLLVGKAGARPARVYARLPGQDEVYLIEADVVAPANRRLEDWRRKEMVAADTGRIARIEVERDGDSYTLVRGESGWTFEGGEEADQLSARNVLSELNRLLASGFYEEGDSIAALMPGGSTMAYSETGELLAQVDIGSGEADRWARVPNDPAIYRLPSFRIDRLVPKEESVRSGP